MKVCESFGLEDVDVELVLPTRKNYKFKEVSCFEYYNAKNVFKIEKIKTCDPNFLMNLPNGIYIKFQILFFIYSLKKYLKKKKKNKDLILYTRDEYLLPVLQKFSEKVVWEAHTLPKNKNHYLKYWEKCHKIVTISQGLKNELIKLGIDKNEILVAPDGVDLSNFQSSTSSLQNLKEKLNLPKHKKIIMYTGHLYDWKGVQVLAGAAEFLSNDFMAVFVGGTEHDVKTFKEKNKKLIQNNKILVLGYQLPRQIPLYLKCADALALLNSGKQDISSKYTSPLKMFEYMASNIPIIASDLPSIKEILNENNAIFFKPDNAEDLAKNIKDILQNSEFADKISKQAFRAL